MTISEEIIDIFSEINDKRVMKQLFEEIFTEKERKDVSLRWQLLKELHEGRPQRKIAVDHKISLCKITRGSKILKNKDSTIKKILFDKYGKKKK